MSSHEIVRNDPIEPGSDRSFGLVVGSILSAIGLFQLIKGSHHYLGFLSPGILLIVFGLFLPRVLRPLNIGWTKLGLLFGRIVTPIVMALIYVISIVPIGIILQISGKDLLSLKPKINKQSYWIERSPPGPTPESLKDQF